MDLLVVTAAIIEHRSTFLLARRRDRGAYPLMWEFPGGKVEQGESPDACLRREILEELAMDIRVGRIYDVIHHAYPERPVLLLAYLCEWEGGEIHDLEVHEHAWVRPEELLKYQLLPADLPLAERIVAEHEAKGTADLQDS